MLDAAAQLAACESEAPNVSNPMPQAPGRAPQASGRAPEAPELPPGAPDLTLEAPDPVLGSSRPHCVDGRAPQGGSPGPEQLHCDACCYRRPEVRGLADPGDWARLPDRAVLFICSAGCGRYLCWKSRTVLGACGRVSVCMAAPRPPVWAAIRFYPRESERLAKWRMLALAADEAVARAGRGTLADGSRLELVNESSADRVIAQVLIGFANGHQLARRPPPQQLPPQHPQPTRLPPQSPTPQTQHSLPPLLVLPPQPAQQPAGLLVTPALQRPPMLAAAGPAQWAEGVGSEPPSSQQQQHSFWPFQCLKALRTLQVKVDRARAEGQELAVAACLDKKGPISVYRQIVDQAGRAEALDELARLSDVSFRAALARAIEQWPGAEGLEHQAQASIDAAGGGDAVLASGEGFRTEPGLTGPLPGEPLLARRLMAEAGPFGPQP